MKIEDVRNLDTFDRFLYWIQEREAIRIKKESGVRRPWTDDDILNTFRFCNVHREDDRVTKWVAVNWREPNSSDPDLWFNMCVARLLNLPESLRAVGYQCPWNRDRFQSTLETRKNSGALVFNAAYIVSTNGMRMDKVKYICDMVLHPLWEHRESIRPGDNDSLRSFAARISSHIGIGSFLSGQVVADLKYATGCPLHCADDWWTWASPGPGSIRGMNRLLDNTTDTPIGRIWHGSLMELKDRINPIHKIHAQDLQNCLCEFDKYERALWGQGRPKQLYRG